MKTATLNIFGDILSVQWTGSVWVSPTTGEQFARRKDAMRAELTRYLEAIGEDADGEEAESLLENIEE